jgi:hypothetical protein
MKAAIPFVLALLVGCGGGNSGKPANTGGEKTDDGKSGAGLKMPGDCVDPLSDGDRHDSTRPFDKHVQQDVRDEDLDGDGVIDAFVKPAWSCGESCTRSVYVVRGTCAHYVGSFQSMEKFESMDTKSNGLKDLSVRPRRIEEDNQMHCYQIVLKFDGTEYKPSKKRECECKDDGAKCTAWDE